MQYSLGWQNGAPGNHSKAVRSPKGYRLVSSKNSFPGILKEMLMPNPKQHDSIKGPFGVMDVKAGNTCSTPWNDYFGLNTLSNFFNAFISRAKGSIYGYPIGIWIYLIAFSIWE
jgi:hypothetical protein